MLATAGNGLAASGQVVMAANNRVLITPPGTPRPIEAALVSQSGQELEQARRLHRSVSASCVEIRDECTRMQRVCVGQLRQAVAMCERLWLMRRAPGTVPSHSRGRGVNRSDGQYPTPTPPPPPPLPPPTVRTRITTAATTTATEIQKTGARRTRCTCLFVPAVRS